MSRVLTNLAYAAKNAILSLWSYRLRTSLTALGVMMGVATIIAILSIIEGLDVAFKDQMSLMGTGTLYVSQMPWIILNDWWRYQGRPPVTRKDSDDLEERMTRAKTVVPFADQRANVDVGRSTLNFVRIIGSTERWAEMSGIEPTEGRFMGRSEAESGREVVIAGYDVVDTMRKQGINIGEKINIAGRALTVIGTLPERGRIFGQTQDDYVVVPLALFERYFGTKRSLTIGVVVDPDELEASSDEIMGLLRARRRLKPDQDNNFAVNEQQMFVELYHELTRSLYATAIGLGIITLIVGGVGIMNVMLVAVAERTHEIGIRKALGARPAAILAQFVSEAGMVSGTGGAIGTTLGLLLAKGVAKWTPLPAAVAPTAIVIGVMFGVFVGLSFGFLPAYRASRLIPVRALSAE
jgi:putative ABC transport system permease protein